MRSTRILAPSSHLTIIGFGHLPVFNRKRDARIYERRCFEHCDGLTGQPRNDDPFMANELLVWNDAIKQWHDTPTGFYSCYYNSMSKGWDVVSLNDFSDGSFVKYFADEEEALSFLRVFLAVKYIKK